MSKVRAYVESSTGALLDAEICQPIGEDDLEQWEVEWKAALAEQLRQLRAARVPRSQWPQSRHWDWRGKVEPLQGLLTNPTFSLRVQAATQGMMTLDLAKTARLPDQAGAALAYVDYLEAAPWNRPFPGRKPRYRGVGRLLIAAAINASHDAGFKGRLGLHSLPQAESFYEAKCGMTRVGADAVYEDLCYFEMTIQQAEAFATGGKRT